MSSSLLNRRALIDSTAMPQEELGSVRSRFGSRLEAEQQLPPAETGHGGGGGGNLPSPKEMRKKRTTPRGGAATTVGEDTPAEPAAADTDGSAGSGP